MFGKFNKKKSNEVKTEVKNEVKTEGTTAEKTDVQTNEKSKQKNDLFTLLEESPSKNSVSKESQSKPISKPNTSPQESISKPNTIQQQTISKTNSSNNTSDLESAASTKNNSNFIPPLSSVKGDKSQLLLLEIEKLHDKTVKPIVDFNENCLFYPILSKIGESPENVSFLDDLALDGTLKKEVFEKLIICPDHPEAFSSSVRLYCPKCNSLNVNKLNLYEHKKCGFITESTEYDFSNPENSTCPSCNKKIVDFKKEIRIPAMWHQCLDCNEKFDNAIIKLYCRQYEHDFETNSGQFVTSYSYKLKDFDAPLTTDDEKLYEDMDKLLNEFNFSVEFKSSIKGKSGNAHKVPIYAQNKSNNESLAIFVNNQSETLSQSDINSILIPILDLGPKHTLLLTTGFIENGVESIAKQYGIQIISDPDLSKIILHLENFVSEKYSKFGEK